MALRQGFPFICSASMLTSRIASTNGRPGEGLLNLRLPDFLDADIAAEHVSSLPAEYRPGRSLSRTPRQFALPIRPWKIPSGRLPPHSKPVSRSTCGIACGPQGNIRRVIHQTRDLQTIRQIKLGLTVVLDHIEILVVRVKLSEEICRVSGRVPPPRRWSGIIFRHIIERYKLFTLSECRRTHGVPTHGAGGKLRVHGLLIAALREIFCDSDSLDSSWSDMPFSSDYSHFSMVDAAIHPALPLFVLSYSTKISWLHSPRPR